MAKDLVEIAFEDNSNFKAGLALGFVGAIPREELMFEPISLPKTSTLGAVDRQTGQPNPKIDLNKRHNLSLNDRLAIYNYNGGIPMQPTVPQEEAPPADPLKFNIGYRYGVSRFMNSRGLDVSSADFVDGIGALATRAGFNDYLRGFDIFRQYATAFQVGRLPPNISAYMQQQAAAEPAKPSNAEVVGIMVALFNLRPSLPRLQASEVYQKLCSYSHAHLRAFRDAILEAEESRRHTNYAATGWTATAEARPIHGMSDLGLGRFYKVPVRAADETFGDEPVPGQRNFGILGNHEILYDNKGDRKMHHDSKPTSSGIRIIPSEEKDPFGLRQNFPTEPVGPFRWQPSPDARAVVAQRSGYHADPKIRAAYELGQRIGQMR